MWIITNIIHEIYDKPVPAVKFVNVDACGEDMIPLALSFTVKPDRWAQIVPNQSVKASYATAQQSFTNVPVAIYVDGKVTQCH